MSGYPRPVSYEGGNRPLYNPGTRPYNPATARQFSNAGNFKEPTFPKPNQLAGLESRNPPVNRPAQLGGNGFNNPSSSARNSFNNKPAFNPTNDPMRGYGSRGSELSGGRNNAFGGYGPGRQTQEFSNRGRASFGGGGGGFHGGGREFGGGGGRRRR